MIQTVIGAFLGCFTAMVVLAEIQHPSKITRYLIALVVGLLASVLCAALAEWVVVQFAKI